MSNGPSMDALGWPTVSFSDLENDLSPS